MIEFFGTKKSVGLFCIDFVKKYSIHFFPKDEEDRFWGKRVEWWDGDIHYFGLGPFLLFVWTRE